MRIMPRITIDTNEVHETAEAARLLGIGYATLYRWIKADLLIPIRIAGRTLIPQSEIDRIKRERKDQATGPEPVA